MSKSPTTVKGPADKAAANPAMTPLDEVDASRAPLIEHLTELRSRLIWTFAFVLAAAIFSFFFAETILNLLTWPYRVAVENFNEARVAKGLPPENADLIATKILEVFFVKLRIALFGGIVLGFPVIAFHVYKFIAPGLYKNEKRAFLPFLLAAPILFLAGACLVFFYIFPYVLQFGLNQQQSFEAGATLALLPKIDEYLSLATTLFIAFGLSFQLPVVITLLGRAGIVSSAGLKKGRRFAIVGIALFAAFVTPPDPITQIVLGSAIYLLYEISIILVRLAEKKGDDKRKAKPA